jgi:hypothetical protein
MNRRGGVDLVLLVVEVLGEMKLGSGCREQNSLGLGYLEDLGFVGGRILCLKLVLRYLIRHDPASIQGRSSFSSPFGHFQATVPGILRRIKCGWETRTVAGILVVIVSTFSCLPS